MHYFKNVELTKLYDVSFATVANWIDAARKGKLAIQLHDIDGKFYIANTVKNQALIEEMVADRKKYFTTRALKAITPSPDFYKLYSRGQILDIISNITTHREIPLQYTYFDGGATQWDRYATRLLNETTPNSLSETIRLISSNLDSIDRLLQGRKHVNVIDLGAGNALPSRGLLSHLSERGVLRRYIGVDISPAMLEIAQANIKEWFGDTIKFEGFTRDFTYDRFKDVLVDDYLTADEPINMVLLLGGTLNNFRNPSDVLRTIYNSMEPGDLLVHTLKLDTPYTRRYFDLDPSGEHVPLNAQFRLPLSLLQIDESWYDVEQLFDEQQQARLIRIRLTVALSIKFEFEGKQRVVDLKKGEAIIVWRARHLTALDVINQFANNGFSVLQTSQTSDHDYLMLVSDIKTE